MSRLHHAHHCAVLVSRNMAISPARFYVGIRHLRPAHARICNDAFIAEIDVGNCGRQWRAGEVKNGSLFRPHKRALMRSFLRTTLMQRPREQVRDACWMTFNGRRRGGLHCQRDVGATAGGIAPSPKMHQVGPLSGYSSTATGWPLTVSRHIATWPPFRVVPRSTHPAPPAVLVLQAHHFTPSRGLSCRNR